ncbi:PQQ-binding-like beta-propeller repeat protein [Duganella sp. CT11-25]|uniref:outer membrane protein assembly factor BamB family protein n=1 Tax=unclassified Duganella TaxID=2636909 RepID=UPI0039AEE707
MHYKKMAVICCWLLAAQATAADGAGRDWTMLMGGPQHAGHIASGGGVDFSKLALAGRYALHAEISASPVAAGGRVYVGAEDGNLHAVDQASRRLLWIYHCQGGIGSTPALADGVLYFLSRDGLLHAVAAADGKPLWQFRTGGEGRFAGLGLYGAPLAAGPAPDPWDLYLSSPLVEGGKVYAGSSDGNVYALDALSGKPLWAFKTGGVVHSSPALAGKNIVIGSWDGAVYALDGATGAERWRFRTRTEGQADYMQGIQASPSVDGDTVYIGARDAYLYAIDAASGAQKWRYDAKGSWVVGSAALDQRNLYVGTSDTGLLLALDKASGQERYRFDTRVWTYAAPLLIDDALVVASMKGEAYVLDAATGKQRWRYQTDAARQDGYRVLDKDGKFDSARLFTEAPHTVYSAVEHVKRLGAFSASPLWHRGQLILATATGELLFFEAGR